MAQRVQDQLDAARNSQSIEDSVKIIADRVFGDMKRLGDIAVRHSFSQQESYLLLSRCQLRQPVGILEL
jgi:hypothetical protein